MRQRSIYGGSMEVETELTLTDDFGALVELKLSGSIDEEDREVGGRLGVDGFDVRYPDGREECEEELDERTRDQCEEALLERYKEITR